MIPPTPRPQGRRIRVGVMLFYLLPSYPLVPNSNAGSILTTDPLSLEGRGLALWNKLNYSTG